MAQIVGDGESDRKTKDEFNTGVVSEEWVRATVNKSEIRPRFPLIYLMGAIAVGDVAVNMKVDS